MSYKNFKLALEKAKLCYMYNITGGVTEEKIKEGEHLLAIKYSKQFKNYLLNIGVLSFFGSEFYGSTNREYKGLPFGDSVVLTLEHRLNLNLPEYLIPIYFFDDGEAFLDYSQLNDDGEPPVILFQYQGEKNGWLEIERLANDLGDFLLQLVEEQLANQ